MNAIFAFHFSYLTYLKSRRVLDKEIEMNKELYNQDIKPVKRIYNYKYLKDVLIKDIEEEIREDSILEIHGKAVPDKVYVERIRAKVEFRVVRYAEKTAGAGLKDSPALPA